MKIANGRDSQNWSIYLATAALLVSLISWSRSAPASGVANENRDSWKNERQYPPLVFNSSAWLDCSISSSANGRQVMNTTSGQGFTFDATMLPIEKSKLQVIGQTGMKYKFDSFPNAAVKAHFTGLGEGLITEMKSEVEVAVARFSQPGGAGTAIHFTAADITADSAYVEFTGLFVRTNDNKHFPFRVLFGRVQDGSGSVIPFSAAVWSGCMPPQPGSSAGQTKTSRCGPAPFKLKPRSVLPPPVKKSSLMGMWAPPNACSIPSLRLFAQTSDELLVNDL